MRLTALAASVLTLAIAMPLTASSQARQATASAPTSRTILPGYWEYDYRVGPIPAGNENKCLKAADAEQFSRGVCTRKYRCEYTTNVVSNGKIQLKGAWTDKKDRVAPVTADGSYTPESFTLNIHMKTINGLPLAGVMTAKRLSAECPAEQAAK